MIAVAERASITGGLSRRRRVKDRAFTAALWACGFLAMLPLLFIAGYVISKGVPALNTAFFTKTPSFAGDPNQGIKEAFIGSGMIVGIASLISIPLGLMAGIYLSEFGRGRAAGVVRFVAEILLSTPSIVAGAFIFGLIVVALHSFSAFAAGLALTVLMWPIIARTTEEVLRLVPQDYREGALALGVPRWRVILKIVVPTAGAGIFTAIMLAVARGLGETAPVLLTAFGNDFVNTNPFRPTDAVSLRVFNYAQQPDAQFHTIAWGGATMLLASVLILSITARILSVRQQRRLG
ncbi:MAG TPA: phosphate ABC transporter permease PstA [Actinomycetota bacterium]|nr:phosphate ABC transporter permease PstA [Actinomycetota bacterium]